MQKMIQEMLKLSWAKRFYPILVDEFWNSVLSEKNKNTSME